MQPKTRNIRCSLLGPNNNLINIISQKFPTHYKQVTTPYQNKSILVSIKFGHCSFEAAMSEWLVMWTRTNSIRVRSPSRWKLFQIMVA